MNTLRRKFLSTVFITTLICLSNAAVAQIRDVQKKLYQQIEDILRMRFFEEKGLQRENTIYLRDSMLVLTDSGFTRKYITRKTKIDNNLKEYPIDTLIKLKPKGIYYTESRIDWYEVPQNNPMRNIAGSVACLIDKDKLVQLPDGRYQVNGTSLLSAYGVCTTENFNKQPVAGFCSAFAVDTDKIVTAGHCLARRDLADIRIVFGFKMHSHDSCQTIFSADEIYTPVTVVASRNAGKDDFAVVRVDQSIAAERITAVRSEDVRVGEPLYVIGHPCGLPMKVAGGAKVVSSFSPKFFTADLDTFGGNSGSAVFDSNHRVVGILVRGARDFRYSYERNCYESNVCLQVGGLGCEGEEISRTSQFISYIQR